MPFILRSAACGFSAIVVVTSLCGQEREKNTKLPDTNLENLQPLLQGIKKSPKETLYEGLPKQNGESELLEKELKKGKSVQLHGFPFYRETVPLKEEDAKKLKELICNPQSFEKQDGGGKSCGGFHPDYLIEWKNGEEIYQVQLCFGCSQMQCFGPKHELLCDINEDSCKQLAKILRLYRKNRPTPKSPFDFIENRSRS